jgi:type II secretory pathway component GspD/PulD (secretin)
MNSKVTRTLIGSALVALLACQALADGRITGITTKTVGDGLEVQIKGKELSAPKITRVMGGRSFMLEFEASLVSDPQWIRVEQAGVHYVQSVVAQRNPDKIRVFLRVDPNTKLDVQQDREGFVVTTSGATGAKKTVKESAPESLTVVHTPQRLHAKPASQTEHLSTVIRGGNGIAMNRMVSLDFVNADIVQILKALSMEAGVNVVTSPDVHGVLTVSLGTVPIKEAMDLITTLSGLRYAAVGNTYVVSSPANIDHILENLGSKAANISETRVVPIYSGEGIHIKDALRTVANDVEILLPSDKPLSQAAINQASQAIGGAQLADLQVGGKGNAGAGAGAAAAAGQSSAPGSDQKAGSKDTYLVLVGPSSRVDTVERKVKDVDEQMCEAMGVVYPLTNVMIHQTYHPQGNTAAALLQAVAPEADKTSGGQFHAKIGTVDVFATPTGSTGAQNIALYGRETEVNRIVANLESIDSLSQGSGDYVVYGVKYLDPRALREDLVSKFPGLTVNVPPASVGQPSVYLTGQTERQNQEKSGQSVGENNGASSNNTNTQSGSTSSSSTQTSTTDDGSKVGITAPFAGDELGAVPMKLVLRGNAEQIKEALSYLDAIDVEPKQVALELRVMQLTKEDALNLGLNWSLLTGGTLQAFSMNQNGPTAPTQGSAAPLNGAGQISGSLGFAGGGGLSVTATLDQLGDSSKMIARPNILALDGKESEMFVGDDIKYIQSIQSTQNGVTITTGDVEVGVKMAVLPRIGADNSVTMEVRPMVSTLESFTPVPGGGEIPQTGLRIAQSTMIMKDGDTIAMGGLIQDTDSKKKDGWPILKDIPILNLLFGRTSNDHTRTEVVFFLTAKVVDTNTMANVANPWGHPAQQPRHGHSH